MRLYLSKKTQSIEITNPLIYFTFQNDCSKAGVPIINYTSQIMMSFIAVILMSQSPKIVLAEVTTVCLAIKIVLEAFRK